MSEENIGLVVTVEPGLGVLHQLTGVIAREQGDILRSRSWTTGLRRP